MDENSKKRQLGRWRTVAVLAVGVAVGTTMMATPAAAHVGGTVAHLWNHLKPLADVRYANAVSGTDKAKNADKLDGRDSAGFVQGKGTVYRNRLVGSEGLILDIPNIAAVRVLNCRTGVPDANVQIDNFSNSQPLDIWRDSGSGDPAYFGPSGGWGWSTVLTASGHTVFELASGTGADARTATIEVWSHANSTRCVFAVTATVYG
jgi:hypothetical protein